MRVQSASSFVTSTPDPLQSPRREQGGVMVTAQLGDSILTAKLLDASSTGVTRLATKVYLAVGLLLLSCAMAAFIAAVHTARANAAHLDQWIGVLGRPASAFRPAFVSRTHDAIALLGLLGGTSLVVVGLRRRGRERRTPWFCIGTAPAVEFATSHAPEPSFGLVRPTAHGFAFHVAPGMRGERIADDGRTPLPVGSLAVPARGRIVATLGNITYTVHAVGPSKDAPLPAGKPLDGVFLTYAAGTMVAFLGLLGVLYTVAPPGEGIAADVGLGDMGLLSVRNDAKEDPQQAMSPETEAAVADEEGGRSGASMALPSGAMGKSDSSRAEGRYQMARRGDEQTIARQAAASAIEGGAIGAAFAAQGGAVFASLTGTGDISSGLNDVDIQGGLRGDVPGEMRGGFGFGPDGFGPGGGGETWGTVGLCDGAASRCDRIGHADGTGPGYRPGRGGLDGGRPRTSVTPPPLVGTPVVNGELDKALIRRYVKRSEEKLRSCYERQLLAKPTLQGTVVVQFFIGPAGNVTSSNASGLDPGVSSCIAGVIKNIAFPKPSGGAGVHVSSYPFEFRPSGS